MNCLLKGNEGPVLLMLIARLTTRLQRTRSQVGETMLYANAVFQRPQKRARTRPCTRPLKKNVPYLRVCCLRCRRSILGWKQVNLSLVILKASSYAGLKSEKTLKQKLKGGVEVETAGDWGLAPRI